MAPYEPTQHGDSFAIDAGVPDAPVADPDDTTGLSTTVEKSVTPSGRTLHRTTAQAGTNFVKPVAVTVQ